MNIETSLIPDGEYSQRFLQGMMNRVVQGFHRYNGWKNSRDNNSVDFVRCMRDRIKLYEETGNSEYLMDVSNFAMAEFMYPTVPGAFFEATSGTPGVLTSDGKRIYMRGE